MKLTTRIRNFFFLRSLCKGKVTLDERYNYEIFLEGSLYAKGDYKKGGCERNMIASVIKTYRNKFPYQIQGWKEAEEEYKAYFEEYGSIKSFKDLEKGTYLTRYRDKYPVKGDKLFDYGYSEGYSTNYTLPWVIRLGKFNGEWGYFEIENDSDGRGVKEEEITAYKYSTDQEITQYEEEKRSFLETSKASSRRREEIQAKIDKKYKEINKLYSKL